MNQPIDFDGIAERADLPALMGRAGVEVRNGKALCPFHTNVNTPALSVFHVGGRWRFQCKNSDCSAKGDAIGWVSMYDRITPLEAAMKLGGIAGDGPGVRQERPARPSPGREPTDPRSPANGAYRRPKEEPAPWADPEWQEAADGIIRRAARRLWSPEGREALTWLRARGLADHTIERFALGFVAEWERTDPIEAIRDRDKSRGISAPRGITIPWCHPTAWYHASEPTPGPRWVGCNVRKLGPDPSAPLPPGDEKCMTLTGSRRGYPYPFADLTPGVPVVIAEGEWDTLIAWQQFGWAVNVVGVGGADQDPKPEALATLDDCPTWLIALHNDAAGNAGTGKWAARSEGKDVRLMLPAGVDLNEMHLGGTDLLGWLRSEFDLLGWRWPLDR